MVANTSVRELEGVFPNEVIRASAGTGKTFALSNRYLKLLASGVECQSILATTFTKKGAGEILDRIIGRLSDAALDEPAAAKLSSELDWKISRIRARDILHELLRNLHRLEISTLDSFFNRVAKAFSLELRLPPNWEIVEEQEINRMKDRAIQAVLRDDSVVDLLHMLSKGEATRRVASMVRETVDQIYDEAYIFTGDLTVFNPNDPYGNYYLIPGNGLINNGGVTPIWHDHYAAENTFKGKLTFQPNAIHTISGGLEHALTEYQWVDVYRPWVGAPIVLNDSTTTPSVSIGSSNDIWKVSPQKGGLFAQDRIEYKGVKATLGMRFNYWAPGKFADNAVADSTSPVLPAIRDAYNQNSFNAGGLSWKVRLLPRLNVSFPVTENNVLYFNYGHSMRMPHPRFMYAGLDPQYQDRSFLSSLGNPNLNPEVNISYEVGYKTLVGSRIGWTINAFNNNRFDYIVSRRVITTDATGRPVTKTMYINQDYAKIIGVETQLNARLNNSFTSFFNGSYQQARGKSNSARESALQIAQTGEVPLTQEQFLAWDRPWKFNAGVSFQNDSSKFRASLNAQYTSGYRYTPQILEGYNDLGRPQYRVDNANYLRERGAYWFGINGKASYALVKFGTGGILLNVEVMNITGRRNAQLVNPITGRAYEYGDDVPLTWRDPRPEFNGPQETGTDPRNPARYSAPTQLLAGIQIKW